MPYRALLATIVTVALALLAVGMWAAVVGPMLTSAPLPATTAASVPAPPDVSTLQLHALARGVLMLSFVLILVLLVVGLFSTARAWIRVRRPGRPRIRTRHVDAWKIAGERLDPNDQPPPLQ